MITNFLKPLTLAILTSAITLTSFAENGNTDTTRGCLANQIQIGTGLDWDGTRFPYSNGTFISQDKYWKITMLPDNDLIAAPACGIILDSMMVSTDLWSEWINLTSSTQSRAIGYDSRPTSSGLGTDAYDFWSAYDFTTSPPKNPARFTRAFKLESDSDVEVTFTMEGKADDIVFIRVDAEDGIAIVGNPSHTNNLYYDLMKNTSHDSFLVAKTLTLSPGIHTIDMDLYDAGGICSGLNVKGTITTEDKVIYSNRCFGFSNDKDCAVLSDTAMTDKTVTSIYKTPKNSTKINIFPNPSNNEINFDLVKAGKYELSIVNILGQVIYKTTVNTTARDKNRYSLLVSDLVSGNYILQVSGEGNNFHGKFTKTN